MENASKALIIAGAILLSILLIALGVSIFQQAKGSVSDTGLDQQAITAFNAKFDPYLGNNIKGTAVQALLSEISASNGANDTLKVNVVSNSSGKGLNSFTATNLGNVIQAQKAGVRATATYTVTPTYDNTGRLISVTIQ